MTIQINLLRKENKNFGDFLIMKKTKEKINLIWRNIHSSAAKKRFFHAKKILSNLAVLGFLATLVSCTCTNPVQPPDPKTNQLGMSNMGEQNVVFFSENTVTLTRVVDFNISNFIIGNSNSDITITSSPGADVAIVDTNNLNINLITGVVSGSLKLNQRLDFENPQDAGDNPTNNQYEIVNFNITGNNADGFNTNFKLFVRITDAAVEPSKIEILIDSYHLTTNNEIRGINEFYLYEDANAPDPTTGSDANNFLSGSLVTNPTVIGEVDPSSSIANLYDGDDSTSGFLTATAINSSSKTYHRLTLNFNEKVNIKKLAIRGRQIGGYQGFIFIMRDKNDNILYVRRANGTDARASGTDADALSTYSLVPSYVSSLYPISDFDIRINNLDFDIGENTTNVILFDNFSVTRGYEYERGFVSFSQPEPGADFDKFDLDNAYFLYNELNGITFKLLPDAEAPTDADSNNVYEVGMVTITNVDGGHTNFNLSVRVVNMPTTVSLSSNSVSYTVDIFTSNIIEDLTEVVIVSNFENELSLGRGTYTYELVGADANHFKTLGNALKTAGDFGFSNSFINNGEYNFQVRYVPEGSGTSATLDVSIAITAPQWVRVTGSAPWPTSYRYSFRTVMLTNNSMLLLGGVQVINRNVWSSDNGGFNWNRISSSWPALGYYEAVVLNNNDILVLSREDNILRSTDEGLTWSYMSTSVPWNKRQSFQAVVLTNGDILVMGGVVVISNNGLLKATNDVWRSRNGGSSWQEITPSAPWRARNSFQAVVLPNNDILVMGGLTETVETTNDVWLSKDGGANWNIINSSAAWSTRESFQTLVLDNGDIFLLGGSASADAIASAGARNEVYLSTNGGTNWNNITPSGHWGPRYSFQAMVSKENNLLVMGGYRNIDTVYDDIWVRLENNPSY